MPLLFTLGWEPVTNLWNLDRFDGMGELEPKAVKQPLPFRYPLKYLITGRAPKVTTMERKAWTGIPNLLPSSLAGGWMQKQLLPHLSLALSMSRVGTSHG